MDLKKNSKTAKTGKVAFLEANKIIKEKRNNQHHTPISYNSDGLQISVLYCINYNAPAGIPTDRQLK